MKTRLIELALLGLKAERQLIDREIEDLRSHLTNGKSSMSATTGPARVSALPSGTAAGPRKGRGRLSPAGRKAISDAMKKRWAERRKKRLGK